MYFLPIPIPKAIATAHEKKKTHQETPVKGVSPKLPPGWWLGGEDLEWWISRGFLYKGFLKTTLPETNIGPENGWLEY